MLHLFQISDIHACHAVREDQCFNGGANEGRAAHREQAVGQFDLRQTDAVVEGTAADTRHARGDIDLRKRGAALKGIVADARHCFGDGDLRQGGTIPEGRISDIGQRAGQLHGLQILKTLESSVIIRAAFDLRHAFRDDELHDDRFSVKRAVADNSDRFTVDGLRYPDVGIGTLVAGDLDDGFSIYRHGAVRKIRGRRLREIQFGRPGRFLPLEPVPGRGFRQPDIRTAPEGPHRSNHRLERDHFRLHICCKSFCLRCIPDSRNDLHRYDLDSQHQRKHQRDKLHAFVHIHSSPAPSDEAFYSI